MPNANLSHLFKQSYECHVVLTEFMEHALQFPVKAALYVMAFILSWSGHVQNIIIPTIC